MAMLIVTRKRALPVLLIFAWTAVLLIIEESFDLLSIVINLIFTQPGFLVPPRRRVRPRRNW
jgi:hypothetical protein